MILHTFSAYIGLTFALRSPQKCADIRAKGGVFIDQRAYFTYDPTVKLHRTSMWLTPHARDWLRLASIQSGLSQALIVDTLIKYYDLISVYQIMGRFTPDQKRAWTNISKLIRRLPDGVGSTPLRTTNHPTTRL